VDYEYLICEDCAHYWCEPIHAGPTRCENCRSYALRAVDTLEEAEDASEEFLRLLGRRS
jgi:hypothetical protein